MDLIFYINTWNLFLQYHKLIDDFKLITFENKNQSEIYFEVKRLESCFVVATKTTNNLQSSLVIVNNSARQIAEISCEINRTGVVFCELKQEADRAQNSSNRRSIFGSRFGSRGLSVGRMARMMNRLNDDFGLIKSLLNRDIKKKMRPKIGSLSKLEHRIWHQCKNGHLFSTIDDKKTNIDSLKIECSVCERKRK